jgi:hypothetical protein
MVITRITIMVTNEINVYKQINIDDDDGGGGDDNNNNNNNIHVRTCTHTSDDLPETIRHAVHTIYTRTSDTLIISSSRVKRVRELLVTSKSPLTRS